MCTDGLMCCWMPKSRSRRNLLIGLGLVALLSCCFAPHGLLEYRLWQARRALSDRNTQQALVWLEWAERLDANRSDLHFWKARAYRHFGKYDKFQSCLDRALRLGCSIDRAKREELLTLAQSGQISKAEPYLPKLLVDAGEDGPEICEAFVTGYLNAFRVDRAFKLLDVWQADYPDDPQPHYCRGMFWERQENWAEASDSFRRAFALAPRRFDVRLHLARALRKQHQYKEAAQHYQFCLKVKPDAPDVLADWGQYLRDRGDTEQAHEVFARLLKEAPDYFDAQLAMGEMELDAGHPQEALQWLEPAAADRPYDCNVRHALGKALFETGQADRAKEHFEFAAGSQAAKARVGALLQRVVQDPNNVECRYEIGTTMLKFGVPSVGVVWLRSVLDIRPDHRPTHAALADYYRQQGNDALATAHRHLAEKPQEQKSGP